MSSFIRCSSSLLIVFIVVHHLRRSSSSFIIVFIVVHHLRCSPSSFHRHRQQRLNGIKKRKVRRYLLFDWISQQTNLPLEQFFSLFILCSVCHYVPVIMIFESDEINIIRFVSADVFSTVTCKLTWFCLQLKPLSDFIFYVKFSIEWKVMF